MATTFPQSHAGFSHASPLPFPEARRGTLATFLHDLSEDLRQRPLQASHLAKHDMFREHINAMAICYFALILLLILASVPLMGYLVSLLGQ